MKHLSSGSQAAHKLYNYTNAVKANMINMSARCRGHVIHDNDQCDRPIQCSCNLST